MNFYWRTFAVALVLASEVIDSSTAVESSPEPIPRSTIPADQNVAVKATNPPPQVKNNILEDTEDLLGDDYQPTTDFCASSLCHNNTKHVACSQKKRIRVSHYFGKKCSTAVRWLPMENDTKTLILDTLNALRDMVAHGDIDAFMPAARMGSLAWDDELAYLAKFNVLQCDLHRDPCRNTVAFKNVGQTVALRAVRPSAGETTNDAIDRMIKLWFKEYDAATMADMEAYKRRHGQPKENFQQIMLENAQKVGCSTVLKFQNGWLKWYFTCNYANSPTVGKPIYKSSSKAGSACQKGKNPQYANLCSVDESYEETGATPAAAASNDPAVVKRRTEAAPAAHSTGATAKVAAPGAHPNVNIDPAVTTSSLNVTQSSPARNNLSHNKRFLHLFARSEDVTTMSLKLSKERHIEIITSNHEVDVEIIPAKYQLSTKGFRNAKLTHDASPH